MIIHIIDMTSLCYNSTNPAGATYTSLWYRTICSALL